MDGATVSKRLVFHVGGYDPIAPQSGAYRRFAREIRRFEATWSAKARVDGLHETADETKWQITTRGPNWHVETQFRFVRWDDVIEGFSRRPTWQRIPQGLTAFLDFLAAGALRGYWRTNWYYAVFFLYPFLMFVILIAIACLAGVLAVRASETMVPAVAVCAALAALVLGFWRWLHLAPLFDDWIFSRAYIRGRNPILEQRSHRVAQEIVAAARGSDADEIVVMGHSLGAVIAVDILDRALKLEPSLGRSGSELAFLSIGSSILKIGLHRGAERFRAAVERVAQSPGIFWGDYQARIDIMNFYKTNPVAEMSLSAAREPIVRLVEFSRMLQRDVYRRIRLRFYRLHCQFISGNDKRASYDYFMLVCGPVSAKDQTLASDGVLSIIGEDGKLAGSASCGAVLPS